MTLAQVLPIVTLYATVFCPNKQPLGGNSGRDYLERNGPETWEIKCCPQGWRFVHRRCSCVPINGLSGFRRHTGVGMHRLQPSMAKGSGNLYFTQDGRGQVDMRSTSGADLHHSINHNTFQLANFIKGHRAKENLNSNRRNALLLRQHRLKLQNNLRQNQLTQRNTINSDILLKGKQIVHIQHPHRNDKRKLVISNNNSGQENKINVNRGQNTLNINNGGFSNSLGSKSILGSNANTIEGTQWFPDISRDGSGSGNGLPANNVASASILKNGFGAAGSSSSNGNFRNNIGAGTALTSTETIDLGGRRTPGMSTGIGGNGNTLINGGENLNTMVNDIGFGDPLRSNGIGVGGFNGNGGPTVSGIIEPNLADGRNFGFNNGDSFSTNVNPETNSNLNIRNTLSGSLSHGGNSNVPLHVATSKLRNLNDRNSLIIPSQSIETGSDLNNFGSTNLLPGRDSNVISENLIMDPFISETRGAQSFNFNSLDTSRNPDHGANSFDQSSMLNMVGSLSSKDITESGQQSGNTNTNGIGLGLSTVHGAEQFSALMRNGDGSGEVGGHTIPNGNSLESINGQQQAFSNLNGGSFNELLNGPNSRTTMSLIDQLIALNMANSMLESGSKTGDLSATNVHGNSMGLRDNTIPPANPEIITSSSFENSLPTDPSMMNNAMLLADTRILESPVSPPSRLVTETILLNTKDPGSEMHTADRMVNVDITASDASFREIFNNDLLAKKTSTQGLSADELTKGFQTGSFIDNMGMEVTRGANTGGTDIDVVNSGIVGKGMLGSDSSLRKRTDGMPVGSSPFSLNTDIGIAAVSSGGTKVLFDGSIKKSPQQPIRPLNTPGTKASMSSRVTSNESGFGFVNIQNVPQIVPRPLNDQSAIETSINQILTISAAETAIVKAAKKSMSIKETAPDTSAKGRFVTQTGLELSSLNINRDNTLSADVCMGCTMDGGLGYIRHPSRCDQFVVCYPDRSGLFKPHVQDCPYGQFWSNIDVTCKPSKDVNCENDYCKKLTDGYQYSHSTNCVAYWQCQAGHSVIRCCPEGRTFVQGEGCVYSSVCTDRCPVSSPLQFMWQVNCNKRPVTTDVTTYEKHVSTGWVSEKCSVGQIYKGEICDCIPAHMGNPTYSFQGDCKPEVFLPFDTDFKDYSGSKTFVRTENVTLSNGAACFDGTSVIAMPKFANMDFGKTVFMKIRYKQMDLKVDTEALLYNGDCEDIPTLVVGTKPSGNSFSVKTNTGAFQTSWVPSSVDPADWRDVTVTISGGRLEGQSGFNARDLDVSGGIARSHCGIKLGWGKKFKSFVGCIDEVSIYRCIPNTSMAADGSIRTSIAAK
ncbi:uncharacterized protein LOC132561956 [Ylistrum balloti]|uniref:uncharacterized protein LOC132561956 n=1 Tax=Ylistrum balloti TaxID=509963 RepID=UPI00290586BA|nr:uncharacterized protein LOC132561956 [Ylistrum balloti]